MGRLAGSLRRLPRAQEQVGARLATPAARASAADLDGYPVELGHGFVETPERLAFLTSPS